MALGEPAQRIIDEGGRQSVDLADALRNPAIAEHDRIVDEHPVGKLHHLPGVLKLHCDADHLDVLARFLDGHQVGYFFQTGRAPGRPEVHDQPFAAVTGKAVRPAFSIGQREIFGGGRGTHAQQRRNQKQSA